MRCCKDKRARSSRSARACCRLTSSWCRRSRKAPTPTSRASPRRSSGSAPRRYSSAAGRSGASFITTNPLPNKSGPYDQREGGSMLIRGAMTAVAVLALLAEALTLAQVAAPKTEPPPKLTFAQIGLFIYPAKGQAADQQKKDEDACYEWAEVNTGLTLVPGKVDAQAAGQAAAKDAGQGKVAGGAAVGAATGLAI